MVAALLLPAAVLAPLLVAALALTAAGRPSAVRLLPAAPLPALAAALLLPDGASVAMPVVVLGTTLEPDGLGRLFLGGSALVWAVAGLHWRLTGSDPADPAERRRVVFFLVTQAGSLGAPMVADAVAFYVFFAVMTIAAYGMIAAGSDPEGRGAGRLYLTVALFGELLTLAAFMIMAAGRSPELAALLLLFGLGSKLGVLPLHVAQAPAYAAMPPAAAAAFAAPVLNAAVYGLLRFLPPEGVALPGLAGPVVVLGLATAWIGGLLAITQRQPRALLGYSTVSQMGMLTVGLAVLAAAPGGRAGVAALAFFAVHHALVKAALLLATGGVGRGRSGLAVAALLALSMAALPPTGGALAKAWLEDAAGMLPEPWLGLIHVGLPLTSALTVLYMTRFLLLLRGDGTVPAGRGGAGAFLGLAAAALAGPWVLVALWSPAAAAPAALLAHLPALLWPVALGAVLAAVLWRTGWRVPAVPPGDVALPAARLVRAAARLRDLPDMPSPMPALQRLWGLASRRVMALERRLVAQHVLGLGFFSLLAVLMLLATL
ncbi:proton-conducting transporter membrane subunit [Azospirillum halopraeferens]|uniref:proton-conducting transporter transmembrane domain-containing protein n=1 Tax=Azospirillum halopraeferens TaxID=34010 RepID=UPI0004273783|nr:proton-conducting transporter membrane subunit [Azospirillum halopraeferens]